MATDRTGEPMNLGALVDALRKVRRLACLRTALGVSPVRAVSYRGFYDQLALVVGTDTVQAGDLLDELEKILAGDTRTGWKGGDFHYDRDTPVWLVMDAGSTSECGITGLRDTSDNYGFGVVEIDIGWRRW